MQANIAQTGVIAVDDILVHEGACVFGDVCTFEDAKICSYINDPTGDFQWSRSNGSIANTQTGPSVDVTYGTNLGSFMYIDVANKPNYAKARLISPIQTKTSGSCVHFYYHAYGRDINQLNLYAKAAGVLGGAVWSMSGAKGNEY